MPDDRAGNTAGDEAGRAARIAADLMPIISAAIIMVPAVRASAGAANDVAVVATKAVAIRILLSFFMFQSHSLVLFRLSNENSSRMFRGSAR